ncbi:Uncharacterized protein P5673_005676, partial [Acropora cervicornis]
MSAFEISAIASGLVTKPDAVQRATLLHCLGPAVQRIFNTLPGEHEKCNSCKKVRHLQKVCRSKPKGSDQNRIKQRPAKKDKKQTSKIRNLKAKSWLDESSDNENQPVLSFNNADSSITVQLNGQRARMIVDTGSKHYRETLYSVWSERAIKIAHVYFIEGNAESLLGRDSSFKLRVFTQVNSVHQESDNAELNSLLKEYSNIFDGLGKVNDFEHNITIDPAVKPISQRLRRIPVSQIEAVNNELDRMVEWNIIEEVTEPSPWVSNLVIVPKKSGDLRVCCDLREVNKAVIRERYVLPKVDDMLHALRGSRYFAKIDAKGGFFQLMLAEELRLKAHPFLLGSGEVLPGIRASSPKTPISLSRRNLLMAFPLNHRQGISGRREQVVPRYGRRGLPFPLSAACSAKQWLVTEPIRRKLTSSIDFVSTVISMRQKLYELQGDSLWEEPTEEKDILKRWKASNSIIHGNVNDLRKYEHIATLSNRNFSKFMEISANADRCTRSGSVTQYTFKSIQKRMSEDELRPAAGVDNETKSPSRSEVNNLQRKVRELEFVIDDMQSRKSNRLSKNSKIISSLQDELSATKHNLAETLLHEVDEELLDISAYKYFLFPHQNARRNHWILGIVIDLEKCTISQVDPAGGKSQEFFDVVRNFLSRRSELKGRQWTVLDIAHPLQNDDLSCGVYILKITECITEKEEIAFQQSDIEEYRWQIPYRLLNNGN